MGSDTYDDGQTQMRHLRAQEFKTRPNSFHIEIYYSDVHDELPGCGKSSIIIIIGGIIRVESGNWGACGEGCVEQKEHIIQHKGYLTLF